MKVFKTLHQKHSCRVTRLGQVKADRHLAGQLQIVRWIL
jgi:hypothetical protein